MSAPAHPRRRPMTVITAAVGIASLVTLALAVPTASAAPTEGTRTPRPDASARLFDVSKVHEISITIPADQLAILQPGGEQRAQAQLTVDGKSLSNVGVRVKQGLGSFRWLDGKAGFSVKTDEFVHGQAIFAEKKFTLDNSITDPSFVADQLTYEAFRAAGIPAPRTAFANLHVNGELFGLYVIREALDKRFLERNFRNPNGNLYEAPFDVDIGDTRMEARTNETHNDKSDVAALGAVIANASDADFLTRVSTLVDVPEFYKYWAVETITAHSDGYASLSGLPFWDPYNTRFDNYRPNNYYTYADPSTGKFVFLPWGADLSLGNLLYMGNGSAVNALWPPKDDARFAVRVYAQPGGPERFRAALASVLDHTWHPAQLVARANALAALVRANGLTSPREETTMASFEAALADRIAFVNERADAVRAQLAAPTS